MQLVKEWNNVDKELFQREILPLSQPAILRGVAKDWEIVKQAKHSDRAVFEYLNKNTVNSPEQVMTFEGPKNIGGRYFFDDSLDTFNFNYISEGFTKSLARIFRYATDANSSNTAYVGGVDLNQHIPRFHDDNPMDVLSFIPNKYPKIWIGNSAKISTHFDELDNLACLVSGSREFTLFPPEQLKNLYIAPFNKNIARTPVSMVNIDNPDFSLHPRYKTALENAQVAKLEPGDALFLPYMWWHNVKSTGSLCTLVNYWWNAAPKRIESPMQALIHAFYSISNLPANEREAWQAFFEYFVFQPDELALSHLTAEEKGLFQTSLQHCQQLREIMLSRMGINLVPPK